MAVEGKVAKILGNNEIVINRGRNEGVRPGMLLEVFAAEGEEVWDPDTGETLGTVEDVKAHAEVTEVKERLAVARLQNTRTPFGAVNIGEMQENLQRMFGQMFGEGRGSTPGVTILTSSPCSAARSKTSPRSRSGTPSGIKRP